MDIEHLIERGRRGDEAALGSLYGAYHRRMTAICQRIVGDRRVAEELAHDAFLLAFTKMEQLRNPRRFESWLTSITTNVALRYMERHHEPQMLSLAALTEEDLAQDTTPADEKPLPTMAELMAAVDALPNGYGQVFRPKIVYPNMTKYLPFCYDESCAICNDKAFIITSNDEDFSLKYLLSFLNSTIAKFWIRCVCPELGEDRREVRKVYFENFRVPIADQQPFIALADTMLSLYSQLQQKRSRFLSRLTENFEGIKITTALQTFDQLDFKAFVKELKKQKIKLSGSAGRMGGLLQPVRPSLPRPLTANRCH